MVEWQISEDGLGLRLVADGAPRAEVSRWCHPDGSTAWWGITARGEECGMHPTLRAACRRACEVLDLPPHAPPADLLAQHGEAPATAAPILLECQDCAATGWATHGDRHARTRMDVCTTCAGTGRAPARTGETPETSAPPASIVAVEINAPPLDPVVEAVRADLLSRSQVGIAKYGVTLARTDLNLRDWLQHAYEETLDQANYLKRSILELDTGKPSITGCAARRQGTAGGNAPADCDWPMCGCDPLADRVIAALMESGHLGDDPTKGAPDA
ncbi:hypothetical protein [Methylobacterium aquaticum]|nr:hypothetical protein [Methylobacterium aquaticum]